LLLIMEIGKEVALRLLVAQLESSLWREAVVGGGSNLEYVRAARPVFSFLAIPVGVLEDVNHVSSEGILVLDKPNWLIRRDWFP